MSDKYISPCFVIPYRGRVVSVISLVNANEHHFTIMDGTFSLNSGKLLPILFSTMTFTDLAIRNLMNWQKSHAYDLQTYRIQKCKSLVDAKTICPHSCALIAITQKRMHSQN